MTFGLTAYRKNLRPDWGSISIEGPLTPALVVALARLDPSPPSRRPASRNPSPIAGVDKRRSKRKASRKARKAAR